MSDTGDIGDFSIGDSPIGGKPRPVAPLSPPPTRLLSWSMMVREADPGFEQQSMRPYVYVLSNGRRFYDRVPLYGDPYIRDDFGTIITDDFGNKITADDGTATGTNTGGFPFGTGAFGTDTF